MNFAGDPATTVSASTFLLTKECAPTNAPRPTHTSGNIVVIRTLAGSANVAGEAIDNMRWSEILGTLSGDNTIFVVTRTPEDAPNVVERFREIIR